ncbi:MAG: TonB-dependent receptor [Vicinamibacterales bacterium]|nr:TonB-dependent receptor [Vicinamibacterales bacterium]
MALHRLAAVFVVLLLAASTTAAQTTAGIAGTARDTTGAVLPGVTVEVASPALIEKVRTAVTDGQGRFNVTDLRPGIYSVTFTLTGFNTFKREGMEISAGFTGTANAEMKVGGLEETVTVTGASPVVDIQNVRTQQVLRSEVLDSLPSGLKDITALAALTLGATNSTGTRNDVGGDRGELSTGISIHGSRGDDGRTNYDGMSTNVFYGGAGGQQRIYKFNTVGIQETVVDTGGNSAESDTGGANVNMIPRDGGNTFRAQGILSYTNADFASGKVPAQLVARNSQPENKTMKKVYDYGIGIGGPVAKDKLWFYNANRWWGNESFAANNYFNKSQVWYRYEADLARQAFSDQDYRDFGVRMTWQASAKHKITFSENWQRACACWMGIGATTAPESSTSFEYGPEYLTQVGWSFPATNKVLFQAGYSYLRQAVSFTSQGGPGAPGATQVTDSGRGYTWGGLGLSSQNDLNEPQEQHNANEKFTVSYVTGSHSFKTGLQLQQGVFNTRGNHPTGVTYTFLNGVPNRINQGAYPFRSNARLRGVGFFVQEQWSLNRLTINAGGRFDGFRGFTLADEIPAGPFLPARSVAAINDFPNMKNITARVGAAYDLRGDGRTAIKASWGKYPIGMGGGILNTISPANAVVASVNRTWNDANGNFVADCTLTVLTQNGECGQVNNLAFGQPVSNITWDESARLGWNAREFNYQWNVTLQHEVRQGLGIMVGYFNTDWRNQNQQVNILQGPNDYTRFSITLPNDPRLGDRAGITLNNLYDVNPDKRSSARTVLMTVDEMNTMFGANGRKKDVYNGVDLGFNWRFREKGLLNGGVSIGRQTLDDCYLNDYPNLAASQAQPRTEEYCHQQSSWWNGAGSQIKLQAVYPLPWGITASASYKHLPGVGITANYVATNAQILPSLGRNLSLCAPTGACNATMTIAAIAPAREFDERLNQIDTRFTRSLTVMKTRIQGIFEIYNLTNTRPSQANQTTLNANYLQPSVLLGGRLFKFGAQVDF